MPLKKLPLYAAVGFVLVYLVLPTFIVIPISLSSSLYMRFPPPGWSLQWYHRYFGSTEWTRATLMSLKVATLTTVLSLLLGTPAAWALVRRNIPGRRVINAIVMWPLAVPVIALSLGLYRTLLSLGLLGSVWGLAVGHTVLAVPFVVIVVSAALRGLDKSLEEAALNLGAGRLQAFRYVVFPLIRPALVTGALFAFSTSWDELIIALYVASAGSKTLPRQMWDTILFERDPTLAAVSSMLVVVSLAIFAGLHFLRRRSAPG